MAWDKVRARRGIGVATIVAAFFVAITAGAVSATAARPDHGFGQSGRLIEPIGPIRSSEHPLDAAALPSGGFVVLTQGSIHAYTPAGKPDRHFGTNGLITVIGPGGGPFSAIRLAVDEIGRIYLLGNPDPESVSKVRLNPVTIVARYTGTGQLDTSFDGDGFLLTDFGLKPPREWQLGPYVGTPLMTPTGIVIDPNGRLLITGARLDFYDHCRSSDGNAFDEGFVARLDSNGALDPTFGEGGSLGIGDTWAGAPTSDATGGLYLQTSSQSCPGYEGSSSVIHLNGVGKPVRRFGKSGRRAVPFGTFQITLGGSGTVVTLTRDMPYVGSPPQVRNVT